MKKIMMFTTAGIMLFCIVSIATTQALPHRTPGKDSVAPDSFNAASVLKQIELRNLATELSNPLLKDNIVTYDMQELRGIKIAQGVQSTSTDSPDNDNPYLKRRDNNNPHVKRSGHGRSKMGDAVAVEDNNSKNEDDGDESGENEEFGDDSTIKYNKGLKNSSGYNEDL